MTEPQSNSLIEELDRQQDEVLAELDQLNQRIVCLLEQHGGTRRPNETGPDEANAAQVLP